MITKRWLAIYIQVFTLLPVFNFATYAGTSSDSLQETIANANALANGGDIHGATGVLIKHLNSSGNEVDRMAMASALVIIVRSRNTPDNIAQYEAGLKNATLPKDSETRVYLNFQNANLYSQAGNTLKADQILMQTLSDSPQSKWGSWMRFNQARNALLRKDYLTAINLGNSVAASSTDSPPVQQAAAILLCEGYFQTKNWSQLAIQGEKTVAVIPDDELKLAVMSQRVGAYRELHDPVSVARSIQEWLALNNSLPNADEPGRKLTRAEYEFILKNMNSN